MKLYVLIRKDLSFSQKAVQGGHVIAKFAANNTSVDWDNQIFVLLKVSKYQLNKYLLKLSQDSIYFETFREPDIGNQITSIACMREEGSFKNLDLL